MIPKLPRFISWNEPKYSHIAHQLSDVEPNLPEPKANTEVTCSPGFCWRKGMRDLQTERRDDQEIGETSREICLEPSPVT